MKIPFSRHISDQFINVGPFTAIDARLLQGRSRLRRRVGNELIESRGCKRIVRSCHCDGSCEIIPHTVVQPVSTMRCLHTTRRPIALPEDVSSMVSRTFPCITADSHAADKPQQPEIPRRDWICCRRECQTPRPFSCAPCEPCSLHDACVCTERAPPFV